MHIFAFHQLKCGTDCGKVYLLGPLATPETSQMSPSPVKMTSGSDLLTKCLEFSQALEQKSQVFNLKVSVGTFSFSLDTRGTTPKVLERKKKLSPSQARRNQKRRENILKKKAASLHQLLKRNRKKERHISVMSVTKFSSLRKV